MRMFTELHTEKSGRVFHDGTYQGWVKEFDPAHPFRYDDGTRFYMAASDVAPWDEFTTDPDASPVKPDYWLPDDLS